jgi:hypothetical protein
VEFSNDGFCVASMACLTASRRWRSFRWCRRRGARMKSALLPQSLFLLAGLIFYVIGMIG